VNTSSQMAGFTLFLFGPRNEFNDLEKPDGLRFVREAEIQFKSQAHNPQDPRIQVRTLYKGAWKEKGTLTGAFR